jgi:hypothetical protein
MNRETKKDTTEFPELNMSIGEYYKMLMEGKRPTRQRRTKEEEKKGPPPVSQTLNSAPALARAASTTSGMNQLAGANVQRRGLDSGALGRSQSEAPGEKTLGSRDISRPNRSHGRSLNKRKLKIKNKMKFTREDGTGMGSAPKIRTTEEKKYGSSSPNLREHNYLKEDLDAL